jgi:hypothetical protein
MARVPMMGRGRFMRSALNRRHDGGYERRLEGAPIADTLPPCGTRIGMGAGSRLLIRESRLARHNQEVSFGALLHAVTLETERLRNLP